MQKIHCNLATTVDLAEMRDSNPRKRSQSPCATVTQILYIIPGGDNRTRTCDLMRVKHAL